MSNYNLTVSKFKDHFAFNSKGYQEYRPTYPEGLFAYLSSIANYQNVAVDCATGTGQSAQKLLGHFKITIAIDASLSQLKSSNKSNNVYYLNAYSEILPLRNNSVDLITVSQALHWFNIEPFFKETERILKKDAVLAIWNYDLLSISEDIDQIVRKLYNDLDPFWPEERKMVENNYRDVDFPFKRIAPPKLEMISRWNLNQLLGYIETWSAINNFILENNYSPISMFKNELMDVWGNPEKSKKIKWPLNLFVFRK